MTFACFEQEVEVEDSQDMAAGSCRQPDAKSTANIGGEEIGAADAGSEAQKSMVRIIVSMYMHSSEVQ